MPIPAALAVAIMIVVILSVTVHDPRLIAPTLLTVLTMPWATAWYVHHLGLTRPNRPPAWPRIQ
jgi:hypothetical protein